MSRFLLRGVFLCFLALCLVTSVAFSALADDNSASSNRVSADSEAEVATQQSSAHKKKTQTDPDIDFDLSKETVELEEFFKDMD